DDADQRGLAGPVGAQQREEVALLDIKIDAFEGVHAILVRFGESANRECIHVWRASAPRLAAHNGRPRGRSASEERCSVYLAQGSPEGQCLRGEIDRLGAPGRWGTQLALCRTASAPTGVSGRKPAWRSWSRTASQRSRPPAFAA